MKQKTFLAVFICLLFFVLCSERLTEKESVLKLKDTEGFKCPSLTGILVPIRLSLTNKIQCLSLDGKKCIKGLNTYDKCRKFIRDNKENIRVHTCSKNQFNKIGHWCQKANVYFFESWHCPEETGMTQIIKFNRNTKNLECLSRNGIACAHPMEPCTKILKTPGILSQFNTKTVSCGKRHFKIWGHKGFNFLYGHWCKKAIAFFKYDGKILFKKQSGISTPIRLTAKGNIQCLTVDNKDCKWKINSRKEMKAILKNKTPSFLTCGHPLRQIRGVGKGFPNWCKRAYRLLLNKKVFLIRKNN